MSSIKKGCWEKRSLIKSIILFSLTIFFWQLNLHSYSSPKRVVSLTVGSDEIVYDMLEMAGKKDKIAGLSSFANNRQFSNLDPAKISGFSFVGSHLESIVKLQPDLVIVASYTSPDFLEKLEKLKIPTIKLDRFSSLSDIKENIHLIGKRLGTAKEAKSLAAKIDLIKAINLNAYRKEKRSESTSKVNLAKDPSSVPSFMNAPLKFAIYSPSGYIMGENTLISDILRKMGFKNTVDISGWPKLSDEAISKLTPDFIVTSGEIHEKEKIMGAMLKHPGWKNVSAVKEKKVAFVPNRLLSATSHYTYETYLHLKNALEKLVIEK